MADGQNAPSAARRRSRAGCLTCRNRRRKCDETKPRCLKCKEKDLECRYGVRVSFVGPDGRRQRQTNDSQPTPTATSFGEFQWQSDPPLRSDTGEGLRVSGRSLQSTLLQRHAQHSTLLHSSSTSKFAGSKDDSAFQEGYHVSGNNGNRGDHTIPLAKDTAARPSVDEGNASFHPPSVAPDFENPPTVIIGLLSASTDDQELSLLHGYRYRIGRTLGLELAGAPWGFGVLVLAQKEDSVRAALVDLAKAALPFHAAGDAAVLRRPSSDSFKISHLLRTDSEELREEENVLRKARVIYESPSTKWHLLLGELFQQEAGETRMSDPSHLRSRLSLAAALLAPHDGSGTFLLSDQSVQLYTYDTSDSLGIALNLLRRSLCFAGTRKTQTTQGASVSIIWQSMWSQAQDWLSSREQKMQPLLDIDQHEVDDESAFPIVMFTNGSAVVANIAVHMACLTFLKYKPRFAQPQVSFGAPASALWHLRRVLGIAFAVRNPAVADPLLAASVIVAARGLSHRGQIREVIGFLRVAVDRHGLQLDEEIASLVQISQS